MTGVTTTSPVTANSNLNKVECEVIAAAMQTKYSSFLGDRRFRVEATGAGDEAQVLVALTSPDKSFHYPIEGRMNAKDEGLTVKAAGMFLLDFIDVYFEEFLTRDGDTYLPIEWAAFECEGKTIHLKGQVLNLKLEDMADEILKRGESVVH